MSGNKHNNDAAVRRQRSLALSLAARVWVRGAGRVHLVRGAAKFQRLLNCLSRHAAGDRRPSAPTPHELGFAGADVEQISPLGLRTRGRALQRWRQAAEAERTGRRRLSAERRGEFERWGQEIAGVAQKLSALYALQRDPGGRTEATLVLTERDAGQLSAILRQFGAGRHLPPQCTWLARVVAWISGAAAATRFLQAAEPLICDRLKDTAGRDLRRLAHRIDDWRRPPRGGERHDAAVRSELRQLLRALPARLVSAGQLTSRLRGRTMQQHLRLLAERCRALLDGSIAAAGNQRCRAVLAALAALAACDGCDVALPKRLASVALDGENGEAPGKWAAALHDLSGRPGYDLLLRALEELSKWPRCHQLDAARRMLVAGASVDDLAWVERRELWYELGNGDFAPGPVRRLIDQLESRLALPSGEVESLATTFCERRDLAVAQRLGDWLAGIPAAALGASTAGRLRRGVWAVLRLGMLPPTRGGALADKLRAWSRPPRRPKAKRDWPEETPAALFPLLERIAWYRRRCGLQGLPKSLRRPLQAAGREAGERRHLRRLAVRGKATPGMTARLQLLEGRNGAARPTTPKLLRAAAEVCTVESLAALERIVARHAKSWWRETMHDDLPAATTARLVAFCGWCGEMDEAERRALRELMAAWKKHGPGYRRHLEVNGPWLAKAASAGVDVDRWLEPARRERHDAAGRQVTIEVETDPLEVFRMGDYFDTCLNLDNGANRRSVLANACHANKAVLYVRQHGRVIGRKLVTLRKDFQMLGYYTYLHLDGEDQIARKALDDAVARFCGRWARAVGVPLANTGEPEELADHFWYDDEPVEWPESGRAAWRQPIRLPPPQPSAPSAPAAVAAC